MISLPWVQMLRAFAALIVVVGHALIEGANVARQLGTASTPPWVNYGFGVDIFFVISGFVMGHAERMRFGKRGASLRFLQRRLIRIGPLYWLLTALVLLAGPALPNLVHSVSRSWLEIAESFLFLPLSPPTGEAVPVLPVGWTLNYELFFYALFAGGLTLERKRGLGAIGAALVGLVLIGLVSASVRNPWASWTNPLLLEFLYGIAISLAADRLSRRSTLLACTLMAGGAALIPLAHEFAAYPGGRFLWNGVPAALMVAGAVTMGGTHPPWPVKPLLVVGDASYSLYLCHLFVLRAAGALWVRVLPAMPSMLFVIVGCAGACVVAVALYRWIERPMTRKLRDLADRPNADADRSMHA